MEFSYLSAYKNNFDIFMLDKTSATLASEYNQFY